MRCENNGFFSIGCHKNNISMSDLIFQCINACSFQLQFFGKLKRLFRRAVNECNVFYTEIINKILAGAASYFACAKQKDFFMAEVFYMLLYILCGGKRDRNCTC